MAVQRIDDFLDGREPRTSEPAYAEKRGRVLPKARASWGAVDGMGRKHDPDLADKVLNEALK